MNNDAGKGDAYRPVDKKKYDENYEAIFRKKISKSRSKREEDGPRIRNLGDPSELSDAILDM